MKDNSIPHRHEVRSRLKTQVKRDKTQYSRKAMKKADEEYEQE